MSNERIEIESLNRRREELQRKRTAGTRFPEIKGRVLEKQLPPNYRFMIEEVLLGEIDFGLLSGDIDMAEREDLDMQNLNIDISI